MGELLLVGSLLAGVVVLTPLAERVKVPQPILLTLFGLALALVPFVPDVRLSPDLILPIVLPPLLFAATQRTTVGEFRESARPVLLLAVGLTVATAAVVAVVSHAAGLPWFAAWVLGAVVSPPDPVAATSVARQLRLPARVVTVLEGEGMFNDSTALVLYKVAVLTAVTGKFSVGHAAVELVLALVVGIGLGFALGWLTRLALAVLHHAPAETTVTAVMPFVAYLTAEHLRGSGVLAVLVLGLFLRSYGHPAITSEGWLLGRAVWGYVDFLLTSLVFALVGFELTRVLDHGATDAGTLTLAAVVLATLVLFRGAWMFPAVWVARAAHRRRDAEVPYGWRETTVVSWSGMRGVVTVATALALPMSDDAGGDFPRRQEIILVALLCVLVTLVLQGLTLSPLVRVLKVGTDASSRAREVSDLRRRAAHAALESVREDDGPVSDVVRRAAIAQYEGYLSAQQALADARTARIDADGDPVDQLREVLERAITVEREVVLRARSQGQASSEAADEVLRDVEVRAVRDFD